MSIKKLNEKPKEFDLSKEHIDDIVQGRLLFIPKFHEYTVINISLIT